VEQRALARAAQPADQQQIAPLALLGAQQPLLNLQNVHIAPDKAIGGRGGRIAVVNAGKEGDRGLQNPSGYAGRHYGDSAIGTDVCVS